MKEILEAVQIKIDSLRKFAYTDEDWGQLDDYGNQCPVKWPCCLIDVQSLAPSDIGMQRGAQPMNRQEGTLTIVLNFANLKLANSSANAPDRQKQQAWLIHGLIQDAHAALHGWPPVEGHGKLMRSGQRKVKREDGVQQHQVTYTIGMHNV